MRQVKCVLSPECGGEVAAYGCLQPQRAHAPAHANCIAASHVQAHKRLCAQEGRRVRLTHTRLTLLTVARDARSVERVADGRGTKTYTDRRILVGPRAA